MLDGAFGLFDRAALDGEDDVPFRLAADANDARPIDDAVPASAADGCAGDFSALRGGLLDGDVLGMEVNEAGNDLGQPLVRILAAQIGVAGVEIDADGGAFDQLGDAVEPGGMFAILLVRFRPMRMPRGSATFAASMSV